MEIIRPEIAMDMFLPIFLVSTLVLIWCDLCWKYHIAKMGYISKKIEYMGYLFGA